MPLPGGGFGETALPSDFEQRADATPDGTTTDATATHGTTPDGTATDVTTTRNDATHVIATDATAARGMSGLAALMEPFRKIAATDGGKKLFRFQIMAATLIVAAFLLFWNLGHYSLWEDEALTALSARGIVRTGDTHAMVDGNLVAFQNGLYLHNLRERAASPLPAYATALSFLCFGENEWAARFPFALAGLLSAAVLLLWAARGGGGISRLLLVSILMLGNASFFLYFRQCRHYGFAMLFTLLVFYLYCHWDGKDRKRAVFLSLSLLGLMCSHYITWAGAAVALALDYALWRRKEAPLNMGGWLVVVIPQAAGILLLWLCWNPMSTGLGSLSKNGVFGVLKLFFLYVRDMNRAEFYSAFLMLVTLGLGWHARKKGLGRAALAVLVMLAVAAFLSLQNAKAAGNAELGHVTALIALCLLIQARGIILLCGDRTVACVCVAFLVAFSNFGNGGMFFPEGVRSTGYLHARELVNPPGTDSFRPVAEWINKNIPLGALVYVEPNASIYPLMFQANRVFYCWQLEDRSREQFKELPPVFFKGESVPDFFVVAGPYVQRAGEIVRKYFAPGVVYNEVARLDAPLYGMHRPEVFTRTFMPAQAIPEALKARVFMRNNFDPAQIPRNPALRPPARTPQPAQAAPPPAQVQQPVQAPQAAPAPQPAPAAPKR